MIENQEHSLTAMTNLLNSLLDISRLDAGAVTPEFESFRVQRIVDRLSAEFARQAGQKKLRFDSVPCNATVRSDPNLLAEIIQNLVSNAIRYTDKGSIDFSCEVQGERCLIRVADTGIGIEPDQLDEIFREFHQVRRPGANKEGFGLGLAIVRRLTNLLEHSINVTSDPGRGSVFSISVPVASQPGAAAAIEEDHSIGEKGHGLVILIEDDVNVADAWGLLLEAEGYRVASAASASEANALIKHLDVQPSLLISDFHLLDGSTGVEAVRQIREYYDELVPAFIVSGDTSKVVKEARLLDNCTLMNKPVDTSRLLAAARIATRSGAVPAD